jgi:hypothetical protein
MADDTNFRSYRSSDPYGRGGAAPAPNREVASDPLAELARLIGQNDPFADLRRESFRGEAPAAAQHQGGLADSAGADWHSGHADPAGAPYGESHDTPQAAQQFGNRPYETQQSHPQHPESDGFQPAYDPAIYGTPQQAGGGYGDEAYYEGPGQPPQNDESYDDVPESPPRRGLKTIMVLTGLVILGAGGAYAYRAMYGGGGTAVPAPVIKADAGPTKVAPTPSGEPSKLIYDRVGDAGQGEKVVSREEQPVDIKDSSRPAPRVIFPSPSTASGSPDRPDSSPTISSTLAAVPSVGPASAEPKKIRTVVIRPDQPLALDSAPKPITPSPRNSVATAAASNSGMTPATTRTVAPKPVSAAPQAGGAPLSISPQGVNTSAPARPLPPPTRTAAATSSGNLEAGSYTVQLSSQRSEPEAQASFRSLQSKYPNLLNDRQPIIRRADLGEKGIYFRAMVGPFASAEEASGFCSSLKSAGGQCVVQRN